jgi:hypothetical protein
MTPFAYAFIVTQNTQNSINNIILSANQLQTPFQLSKRQISSEKPFFSHQLIIKMGIQACFITKIAIFARN